mgnify:CR=1 FL=1
MSKFHNVPRRVDGILFHSGKEARRYQELKLLEQGGVISGLELQKRFRLDVNGVHVCDYICDFSFHDNERRLDVVEDVKGWRTEIYKFKKRLMLACLGIEVEET